VRAEIRSESNYRPNALFAMTSRKQIAAVQSCLGNPIDASLIGDKQIAGIVGDAPSFYSKSPALWNAAFDHLGINGIYLPFDVAEPRLGELIATLKGLDNFLGINVTVPHKIRIMDFLDEIDPGAKRVQAVNTIVRTSSGKLVGCNTDGAGFIESLLTPLPGETEPFVTSLAKTDVLLLGAGGSARALAFELSDRLDEGQLVIANRNLDHAMSLAAEIQKNNRRVKAIDESEIGDWARKVGLIVNSTTKGQGGLRKLPNGKVTTLEPYSALVSAYPAPISQSDFDNPQARQKWLRAAQADIDANNQASMILAQRIPEKVRFYDLIYHPEETVFLRHGRLSDHLTKNGRAMIIFQAAIALCKHLCKQHLRESGKDNAATYRAVCEVMAASW
jgi:shikimate dehydrogenase